MQKKLSFSSYLVIGVMLFALFFGAGNLIFPAQLGQYSGENLWPATFGFLLTGAGLPLLGILAMGFSGSKNLQELASRVHPVYGLLFTSILYLTIGPFFAAPRTGAVAFDIGIASSIPEGYTKIALLLFTLLFFGITLWLSLNPAKIVDRIGKLMSPIIIILLLVLLTVAFINPMGEIQSPVDAYAEGAFVKGLTEGYNTMDALASLVFGIIVINVLRSYGLKKMQIFSATVKTGVVASGILALLYVGIAYLGATTTERFGLFETGGPVLSEAASYYFGTIGTVMLAIVIILACLTTSIGLITACGEYFNTIIPKVGYKTFVTGFTVFCFVVSNFGLANIITYSIPVLMLLYPLAVVLMLLTFTSPLFGHARIVYLSATATAFFISVIDGIKTLYSTLGFTKEAWPNWLTSIDSFYNTVLPFYSDGLGWVLPVLVVMIFTGLIALILKLEPAHR
ncbi:branched-chain amino acid transport system II carrier protein [Sporosarcina highlanderae]|uniref:Branched-chain amino acid transport system carrier protein n=1 Tax=Sporosarcina highlanderae TaxID=3035916 RepID=A0ABT8JRC3_9BACL|nr:branched-chain amino acid transport system II carrier protein [Sporosarcina highlanderae]MDN4606962.1 branched-chain amino acid transport system II carrier protein [Sporosarcina highlanderae]